MHLALWAFVSLVKGPKRRLLARRSSPTENSSTSSSEVSASRYSTRPHFPPDESINQRPIHSNSSHPPSSLQRRCYQFSLPLPRILPLPASITITVEPSPFLTELDHLDLALSPSKREPHQIDAHSHLLTTPPNTGRLVTIVGSILSCHNLNPAGDFPPPYPTPPCLSRISSLPRASFPLRTIHKFDASHTRKTQPSPPPSMSSPTRTILLLAALLAIQIQNVVGNEYE